jgi:hypothetical protein
MALFQCERYPRLIVLDPRKPTRVLAQFHDGVFETEDEFTIAELAKHPHITRLDSSRVSPTRSEDSDLPLPALREGDIEGPDDRLEELTALVEEALSLGVLQKRGQRVYFNARKIGDSKINAVHVLKTKSALAKEIERELERVRLQEPKAEPEA